MLPTTKARRRNENAGNSLSLLTPWQKDHSRWACVPQLPNKNTKFYLVHPFEQSYAAIPSFISISLLNSNLMQLPGHTCMIQCLEPKRTQKNCGAHNIAHVLVIYHIIKNVMHYGKTIKLYQLKFLMKLKKNLFLL